MSTGRYQTIIAAIVVIAALLGFATISVHAIYQTIKQHNDPPQFSDALVYIANALTGLVGGVVAIGFGQAPPESNNRNKRGRLIRKALGLGRIFWSSRTSSEVQEILGIIYAAVYVLLGMAAIVVWGLDDNPPDLLKNLATVALGLFVPIVTAFFKEG